MARHGLVPLLCLLLFVANGHAVFPQLGPASQFTVFAAIAVRNPVSVASTSMVINGDIGIDQPSTSGGVYTGFTNSQPGYQGAAIVNGFVRTRCSIPTNCPNELASPTNDLIISTAINRITLAQECFEGLPPTFEFETSGPYDWLATFPAVVRPGVYTCNDPYIQFTTGDLVFDGEGNPNSTWTFQLPRTTFRAVTFTFINLANPNNIVWVLQTLDINEKVGGTTAVTLYGIFIVEGDVQANNPTIPYNVEGVVYTMGGTIRLYYSRIRQFGMSTSPLCLSPGYHQGTMLPTLPLPPPTISDDSVAQIAPATNTCEPFRTLNQCGLGSSKLFTSDGLAVVMNGALCVDQTTDVRITPAFTTASGIHIATDLAHGAFSTAESLFACAVSRFTATALPTTPDFTINTTNYLRPGTYYISSDAFSIKLSSTGTLGFDGRGDPLSRWVIHLMGDVDINSIVTFKYINGAFPGNVIILVDGNLHVGESVDGQWFTHGDSVTIDPSVVITGRILALRGEMHIGTGVVVRTMGCTFPDTICSTTGDSRRRSLPTRPPLPSPPTQNGRRLMNVETYPLSSRTDSKATRSVQYVPVTPTSPTYCPVFGVLATFGILGRNKVIAADNNVTVVNGAVGTFSGTNITFGGNSSATGGYEEGTLLAYNASVIANSTFNCAANLGMHSYTLVNGSTDGFNNFFVNQVFTPGYWYVDVSYSFGIMYNVTYNALNDPNAIFVIWIRTNVRFDNVMPGVYLNQATPANVFIFGEGFATCYATVMGPTEGNYIIKGSFTGLGPLALTGRLISINDDFSLTSTTIHTLGCTATTFCVAAPTVPVPPPVAPPAAPPVMPPVGSLTYCAALGSSAAAGIFAGTGITMTDTNITNGVAAIFPNTGPITLTGASSADAGYYRGTLQADQVYTSALAAFQCVQADLATYAPAPGSFVIGLTFRVTSAGLTPGKYVIPSNATAVQWGNMTLDGQNDPTSAFIFALSPSAGTVTVLGGTTTTFTNSASACQVFLFSNASFVAGSAVLRFDGNVITTSNIVITGPFTSTGRFISLNGSTSFTNALISPCGCTFQSFCSVPVVPPIAAPSTAAAYCPALGNAGALGAFAVTTMTLTSSLIQNGAAVTYPTVNSITATGNTTVTGGMVSDGSAASAAIYTNLVTAYNCVSSRAATFTIVPGFYLGGGVYQIFNLANTAFPPGNYTVASNVTLVLMDQMFLDGQNDVTSTWTFYFNAAISTSSGSGMVVINGGTLCNVFIFNSANVTVSGTSDTIGRVHGGTFISRGIVSLGQGKSNAFATRAASINSSVSLSSVGITSCGCTLQTFCAATPPAAPPVAPPSQPPLTQPVYCAALGTGAEVGAFGFTSVSLTTSTITNGAAATFPANSLTFASGSYATGGTFGGTAHAQQIYTDLQAAYDCIAQSAATYPAPPGFFSGTDYQIDGTITPGRYAVPSNSTSTIYGSITFSGASNPNSTFIFYAPGILTFNDTASSSYTQLATAGNVVFAVEGRITANNGAAVTADGTFLVRGSSILINTSPTFTGKARFAALNSTLNFQGTSIQPVGCTATTFCLPSPPTAPPPGSAPSTAFPSCPAIGSNASRFGILGSIGVNSTGQFVQVYNGEVGSFPVAGVYFPPPAFATGGIEQGTATAGYSLTEANAAYTCAVAQATASGLVLPGALSGNNFRVNGTVTNGYYLKSASNCVTPVNITFDGQGSASSVFVIVVNCLRLDVTPTFNYVNQANVGQVKWFVTSTATDNATFTELLDGDLIASGAVTLNGNLTIRGRIMSLTSTVQLGPIVVQPQGCSIATFCAAAPVAPPVSPPILPPTTINFPYCQAVGGNASRFGLFAWGGLNSTNNNTQVYNGAVGAFPTDSVTFPSPAFATGGIDQGTLTADNAFTETTAAYSCLFTKTSVFSALPGSASGNNWRISGTLTGGIIYGNNTASGCVTPVNLNLDGGGSTSSTFFIRAPCLRLDNFATFTYANGASVGNVWWLLTNNVLTGDALVDNGTTSENLDGSVLTTGRINLIGNVTVRGRLLTAANNISVANTVVLNQGCDIPTFCVAAPTISPFAPPSSPPVCPALGNASIVAAFGFSTVSLVNTRVNVGAVATYPTTSGISLTSGTSVAGGIYPGTVEAQGAYNSALSVYNCVTLDSPTYQTLPGSLSVGIFTISGTITPGKYTTPAGTTSVVANSLVFNGQNTPTSSWVVYIPVAVTSFGANWAASNQGTMCNALIVVASTVSENAGGLNIGGTWIVNSTISFISSNNAGQTVSRMISLTSGVSMSGNLNPNSMVACGCTVQSFCNAAPVAPPIVASPVAPPTTQTASCAVLGNMAAAGVFAATTLNAVQLQVNNGAIMKFPNSTAPSLGAGSYATGGIFVTTPATQLAWIDGQALFDCIKLDSPFYATAPGVFSTPTTYVLNGTITPGKYLVPTNATTVIWQGYNFDGQLNTLSSWVIYANQTITLNRTAGSNYINQAQTGNIFVVTNGSLVLQAGSAGVAELSGNLLIHNNVLVNGLTSLTTYGRVIALDRADDLGTVQVFTGGCTVSSICNAAPTAPPVPPPVPPPTPPPVAPPVPPPINPPSTSPTYCPAIGNASAAGLFSYVSISGANVQITNGDASTFPSTSAITFTGGSWQTGGIDSGTLFAGKIYTDALAAYLCMVADSGTYSIVNGSYTSGTVYQVAGTIIPGKWTVPANVTSVTIGTIVYDGLGTSTSSWSFYFAVPVTISPTATQSYVNSASACNIFTSTGNTITAASGSPRFDGTTIALGSITATGVTNFASTGRLLSLAGSVTINNAQITPCGCTTQTLCAIPAPITAPTISPPPPSVPPFASTPSAICPAISTGAAMGGFATSGITTTGFVQVLNGALGAWPNPNVTLSAGSYATGGTYNASLPAQTAFTSFNATYACILAASPGYSPAPGNGIITPGVFRASGPLLPGNYVFPSGYNYVQLDGYAYNGLNDVSSSWVFYSPIPVLFGTSLSDTFLNGALRGNIIMAINGSLSSYPVSGLTFSGTYIAKGDITFVTSPLTTYYGRFASISGSLQLAPGSVIVTGCTLSTTCAPVPVSPPSIVPSLPPTTPFAPAAPASCIPMGGVASFAAFAAVGVSASTSFAAYSSRIGSFPDSGSISFPYGAIVPGGVYQATNEALLAYNDAQTIYYCIESSQPSYSTFYPIGIIPNITTGYSRGLGDQILSGLYIFDGQNQPTNPFIVYVPGNLVVQAGSSFMLANQSHSGNVIFVVTGSILFNGTSTVAGSFFAMGSITSSVGSNVTVFGRLISMGSISLVSATIITPGCTLVTICPSRNSNAPSAAPPYCPAIDRAAQYGIMGAYQVSSSNPIQVANANVGTFPATQIFLAPGSVIGGQYQAGTQDAAIAFQGATNAFNCGYNTTAPLAPGAFIPLSFVYEITGAITPGYYTVPSNAIAVVATNIVFLGTGSLLDKWIFSMNVTLQLGYGLQYSFTQVNLSCHVFWLVNSSVTPYLSGSGPATAVGTIIAMNDITVAAYETLQGRLISLDGGVSTAGGVINPCGCSLPTICNPPPPPPIAPPLLAPVAPPITPNDPITCTALGPAGAAAVFAAETVTNFIGTTIQIQGAVATFPTAGVFIFAPSYSSGGLYNGSGTAEAIFYGAQSAYSCALNTQTFRPMGIVADVPDFPSVAPVVDDYWTFLLTAPQSDFYYKGTTFGAINPASTCFWVFYVPGNLHVVNSTTGILPGSDLCAIIYLVNGAVTFNSTNGPWYGDIISTGSITVNTSSPINGRLQSLQGSVSFLQSVTISPRPCTLTTLCKPSSNAQPAVSPAFCPALGAPLSEFGILAATSISSSSALQVNYGTIGMYPNSDTALASGTTASFPYQLGSIDARTAQLMAQIVFGCATDPLHGFVNAPGSTIGPDWLINGTVNPGYYTIPIGSTNAILGQLTFNGTGGPFVFNIPNSLLVKPYLVHAFTSGASDTDIFFFVSNSLGETTTFTVAVTSSIPGNVFVQNSILLDYSYTNIKRAISLSSSASFGMATFIVTGCATPTFCISAPIAAPIAPPIVPPVSPPSTPPIAPPTVIIPVANPAAETSLILSSIAFVIATLVALGAIGYCFQTGRVRQLMAVAGRQPLLGNRNDDL